MAWPAPPPTPTNAEFSELLRVLLYKGKMRAKTGNITGDPDLQGVVELRFNVWFMCLELLQDYFNASTMEILCELRNRHNLTVTVMTPEMGIRHCLVGEWWQVNVYGVDVTVPPQLGAQTFPKYSRGDYNLTWNATIRTWRELELTITADEQERIRSPREQREFRIAFARAIQDSLRFAESPGHPEWLKWKHRGLLCSRVISTVLVIHKVLLAEYMSLEAITLYQFIANFRIFTELSIGIVLRVDLNLSEDWCCLRAREPLYTLIDKIQEL
jgi:hypothetical protein